MTMGEIVTITTNCTCASVQFSAGDIRELPDPTYFNGQTMTRTPRSMLTTAQQLTIIPWPTPGHTPFTVYDDR